MIKMVKKIRPVFISWKDHYSLGDGWTDVRSIEKSKEFIECNTVGFLIAESKESFFVSLNYSDHQKTSSDTIAILKSCVISKRFIK